MQDDRCPARHPGSLHLVGGRELEAAGATGRTPHPGLRRSGAAAGHLDPVRHHEGRIEADPELADEAGAVLGLGQPLDEGTRARAGHGAEIVDQFLAIHADAAVGDCQGAGIGVGADLDCKLASLRQQVGGCDRLVAQPVASVGGVGDQLAQEHVGLGIDRVHHQPQELGNLSLKRKAVGRGFRLRWSCGSPAEIVEVLYRVRSNDRKGPAPQLRQRTKRSRGTAGPPTAPAAPPSPGWSRAAPAAKTGSGGSPCRTRTRPQAMRDWWR